MTLTVQEAIVLYKELYSIPGKKDYNIERAMESLEKYIFEQLKELTPPAAKPSTTTDDEIPF